MEDRKPSRHRAPEDVRRQKRKELDARRSKTRIRLGTHLEQWCHVKDQLGFHLHSDFAKFLLDSYASKSPVTGSGAMTPGEGPNVLRTSSDALRQLVVWSHDHSRECGFIPDLKSVVLERSGGGSLTAVWECIAGHSYPWLLLAAPGRGCPPAGARTRSRSRNCEWVTPPTGAGLPAAAPPTERAVKVEAARPGRQGDPCRGSEVGPEPRAGRRPRGELSQREGEVEASSPHGGRRRRPEPGPGTLQLVCESDSATDEEPRPDPSQALPLPVSDSLTVDTPDGNDGELEIRDESDEAAAAGAEGSTDDDLSYADDLKDQNYSPSSDSSDRTKRKLQPRLRGRLSKESPNNGKAPLLPVDKPRKGRRVRNDPSEEPQIPMRKIRKKAPMEILRCEFEGCGKVVSNRQYLKHHMKYQHLLQKTFACSHPSCGRSFNFKKHLKEHEKLHSDKRDYICEFCARQFRTTSNLIIHRRIHTGEKPLQCEICGFTCRQKASLNWHMKKHDAEAGYQFSCDVCGKRFEKKDNVSAHKRKSHPEAPAVTVTSDCPAESPSRDWTRLETKAEPGSQPASP